MVQLLEEAVKVWNDPADMIDAWKTMPDKSNRELQFLTLIEGAESIADVGCGPGRMYNYELIKAMKYTGFDQSPAMISAAQKIHPYGTFCSVNVYEFQPTETYDIVLMQDVIQHADDPLEAMHIILRNWVSYRYLISVLVGPEHEDLYASTVVSYDELFRFFASRTEQIDMKFIKQFDDTQFFWAIIEFSK